MVSAMLTQSFSTDHQRPARSVKHLAAAARSRSGSKKGDVEATLRPRDKRAPDAPPQFPARHLEARFGGAGLAAIQERSELMGFRLI